MWLTFQDIYKEPNRRWAEVQFDRWCSWARRSRLKAMKQFAATLMRHRDGILAWFDSRIANGLIEGINSLVQAAKAKARAQEPRGEAHTSSQVNLFSDYPLEKAESLFLAHRWGPGLSQLDINQALPH